MKEVIPIRVWCALLFAPCLFAQQTQFFPLSEVRPGLHGVGRTVFSGSNVEEFQVEILGVLENIGPKQSLVLARLSGGPLEHTGVMQGMSGSPVYINGRLLGAVASAFEFAKDPIAGIRPIEEMLRDERTAPTPRAAAAPNPLLKASTLPLPKPAAAATTSGMVDIATPVSFGGFTERTLEQFGPQLRALGLKPVQGSLGGGNPGAALGNPSALQPGSMISVQLIAGDMTVGADGTVTYIDGNKMYAFGHRFLAMGSTDMPFARAEVLTLLANVNTSFKISAAKEWMGTITSDHGTAVSGELGRKADTVPVRIAVKGRNTYNMQIVHDPFLTPSLLQMAVFSAVDATERVTGISTLSTRTRLEFADSVPPVTVRNLFSESNIALQAANSSASPLAYAMQSGFPELALKQVDIEIESSEERRDLNIDQAWSSRDKVRPGESFDIYALLSGPGGVQMVRKSTYTVPVGAPVGPLQIAVTDASTANLAEYLYLLSEPPNSAGQLVSFLNGLRPNDAVYMRVTRTDPSFQVQGHMLPDPPPSLSLILRRSPGNAVNNPLAASSKLAEFALPVDNYVVSGSKTIQVDVEE